MTTPFDFESHRQKAISEYSAIRPQYERFASAIESILRTLLRSVPIHQIASRAKAIESFADKASKYSESNPSAPRYPIPLRDIKDLAAARVIVLDLTTKKQIDEILRREFGESHRDDKGQRNRDRGLVGYESIHFEARLDERRLSLPEYADYSGLVAEIQLRTVLEHAWAEIEHDVRYKSRSDPNPEISQRFAALAVKLQ